MPGSADTQLSRRSRRGRPAGTHERGKAGKPGPLNSLLPALFQQLNNALLVGQLAGEERNFFMGGLEVLPAIVQGKGGVKGFITGLGQAGNIFLGGGTRLGSFSGPR